MGVILAKFRREKSTQAVLETLEEKIEALEAFTINTQKQKKRIVTNFIAVSIGVYVIAFMIFYFLYSPPTWKDRIAYCIPLLLFPIIIILLRYLFTWYFQRQLNKNSKNLTALKAEKKKILEQVMDKETYKVAVNLLARFGDKPTKLVLTTSTSSSTKEPLNRYQNLRQKLDLTSTLSPTLQIGSPSSPTMASQNDINQKLRRRTPFPIINQQERGVFDRIVDILIGDGPQHRFAMICKKCYSHNGMALKDDFEYTTFTCAFCNGLNPARKIRPVAPRLVLLRPPVAGPTSSDTSDSETDKDDSDDKPISNGSGNINESSTPKTNINSSVNSENENTVAASLSLPSPETDEEKPQSDEVQNKKVEKF